MDLEINKTLKSNYPQGLGDRELPVSTKILFEELKGSEAAMKMRLQADHYDSTTKNMRSRYLTHKNIAQ